MLYWKYKVKWGKRNTGKNTVNWGGLIMVLKTDFEYVEGKGKPKPRKRDGRLCDRSVTEQHKLQNTYQARGAR